ncbi:Protein ecdysoneless-like protein [Psilocybe cubensis]|uniref:Protein ecdysoneless-like protein n=2 Tax=Psilocybe cubensis TaxID=181762 RepID=A0ACB8HGQ8_PSICU|nr:Protein ecdysoneless-like protein [Psilocybe cubensis]KAH9487088.1 Protein ecdysoneless-like protein [Psilocybe cubensis]
MDIFNRPHSIAEDTLHFSIYPPSNLSDKTSASSFAACIIDYVQSLLPGFIWHRDKFEVKVAPNSDGNGWILESKMRVGDCVDDEWLTVWLLKQISSKWDVVISVYDSDGEFLLIEAADTLPSWVKPTNSENRVWIYNSRLHLIPLSHISPPSRKRHRRKLPGSADSDNEDVEKDDDEYLATEDAIKLVRDASIETLAPPAVEKTVWERISGYPDAAKAHLHVAKAYLPVDIAKCLIVNPSLIQRAVETFYTRDSIQLRAAHRMSRFPPNPSVLTSVKMTRTAYAQLVGQKFFPPKIFGHLKEQDGTDEWRWREVGMKIAVGFEMLYQESKGRTASRISSESASSAVEATKEALRRNPEYQKYIENLKSANYFKGEIQGSQLWNSLENKAAATYVEVRRVDDATRQSFASQVDEALQHKNLPDRSNQNEDSDEWLNVDAQQFEEMLEEAHNKTKVKVPSDSSAMEVDGEESAEDRLASQQAKQLKDLASKVEDFIEGEGDVEGALFNDEDLSDDLLSDDPDTSESESELDLDSKFRSAETRSAERQAAMDKLVPGLDASDYGRMPASYHSNSQRVLPDNKPSEEPVSEAKSEDLPKPKTVRPPIIPRDKYDGVDSDDETDQEANDEDDESEEDRPQVVGEIEIDMEQEEEEFLEFSRQALGITEEQWSEIVQDRKNRGVFLPSSAMKTPAPTRKPPMTSEASEKKHTPRVPESGPRPNVNPELDSFEAIMNALDEALAQSRKPSKKSEEKVGNDKGKGKDQASESSAMNLDEDDDFDIDAAMEAELKEALEVNEDSDTEQPADYKMIKNLLESFKSQEGLSGPFSNLAGRLKPDFKLPRDES